MSEDPETKDLNGNEYHPAVFIFFAIIQPQLLLHWIRHGRHFIWHVSDAWEHGTFIWHMVDNNTEMYIDENSNFDCIASTATDLSIYIFRRSSWISGKTVGDRKIVPTS